MLAGSLVFETPVDTKGVETGAKKIEGELGGLKNVANETGKAIKDAFSGEFSKPIASAQAKINDLLRQLETVSVSFKEAIAADDDSAAEKYGRQRIRIYDQIEAAREKLSIAVQEASQKQADAEKKAAEKSEKAYLKSYSNMRKSFSTAERTARRFGRRLRSIISGALVFNLISSGLRGFTSYLGSALKTNKEFTTQLAKLKGALLTAFQPIYTYVLPVIVKLMQYLTSAANAVAYFFSILTGSSIQSSANAAENLYNEANAIGAVGGAAKKAKKALAGFDEINVLQSTNDEGSGGGSSIIAPDFSGFENSALSAELETVMGKLKTIAGYIPVIAAGLIGLKLGSFLADLFTANIETKTLKDALLLLGKKTLIMLEIGVLFGGVALFGKGIADAFKEGVDGVNFAEILGSGLAVTGVSAHLGAQLAAGITTAFEGSAVANALAAAATNLGVGSAAAAGAALSAAGAGIILGIPMMIVGIYDAIKNGLDWLSGILIPLGATLAATGIGAIIGACIGSIGGPAGAAIGALIGLAVGLITDCILSIIDICKNGLNVTNGLILAIATYFLTAGMSGIPTILAFIISQWESITTWFGETFPGISQWFANLWQSIVDIWGVCAEWFDATVIQPVVDFFSNLWTDISSLASECWDGIVDYFSPAIEWFSQLFSSVYQTLSDIFYNIGVIASGCWEIITTVWGIVSEWFDTNVIQPVSEFFSNLWTDVSEWAIEKWASIKEELGKFASWIDENLVQPVTEFFSELWTGFSEMAAEAWSAVCDVFSKAASFFEETFRNAWQGIIKVFSIAGEIFVNIKDGILSAFKFIVNGLITGLNSAISVPFNGINAALRKIRDINIVGLSPFSALKTVSVPSIPYLAQGAVLPANKPFMAVVGDQKHGTNVEAPLTVIQEAVAAVMEDYSAANMAGHEAIVAVLRELLEAVLGISIGDDVIAGAVSRYDRKMAVVKGG